MEDHESPTDELESDQEITIKIELPDHDVPQTEGVEPQFKPVVETYNGDHIKKFSLSAFHPDPEAVPEIFLQQHQNLKTHILQTTLTYLSLWKLDTELDLLDLRFCAAYTEKLQIEYMFLGKMLSDIFKKTPIQDVMSIKKLQLPQIQLQPQVVYPESNTILFPHAQIMKALKGLEEAKCTIGQIVLPVKCALEKSDVTKVDYKALAASFLKFPRPQIMQVQEGEPGSTATSTIKVTFACASKDSEAVIRDVQRKLNEELKKSNNEQNLKISYSASGTKDECTVSTRAESRRQSSVGEIHPAQLFGRSSNHSSDLVKVKLGKTSARKFEKTMVTTDCVWLKTTDLSRLQSTPSQLWNLEQLHASGITGSGTVIAIVDTGIHYAHCAFDCELKNKILQVKNFVPNETDNSDCIVDSDGHGTLCAGVAAGFRFTAVNCQDSSLFRMPSGVAPGAQLIVCKVFKEGEKGAQPKIIAAALQWLVEYCCKPGHRLDVVSLSFGTTKYPHEIAHVISDLVKLGVIVVCAASNDGRMRLHPISFPARLGHVLCIGAQDDQGKPTSFSPVGRELDFLAPGYQIIGPGPGILGINGTKCANGTSFAAPAVAGLVCLVLQYIRYLCGEQDSRTHDGRTILDCVRNVWVMKEILKEMSSSPGHHAEELGYGTLIPSRIFNRCSAEIVRLINDIIVVEDCIPSAKRKKT